MRRLIVLLGVYLLVTSPSEQSCEEEAEGIDILYLQEVVDKCGVDTVLETCECGYNQLYWNECVYGMVGPVKDGPTCGDCLDLSWLNGIVITQRDNDKPCNPCYIPS